MWQNTVCSCQCFLLLSVYADSKGVGNKVGTRPRLGGSTLKTSLACSATLVAALAVISVKMSGCVSAAAALSQSDKELDANRSLDLMRTLNKVLLTKCTEVSHLNWFYFSLKKKILGVCNLFEHVCIYPSKRTLHPKTLFLISEKYFGNYCAEINFDYGTIMTTTKIPISNIYCQTY